MGISLPSSKAVRVAYLGPAGTHSERGLREFLPTAQAVPCFSISDIFHALLNKEVEAGFVPVENMIQGPVTETLDLLFEYQSRVCISNSYLCAIENALGVLPEALCKKKWPRPVKKVISHDQPLRQCSKYLQTHFPLAERVAAASTGAAVLLAKESHSPDVAVIASRATLEENGFSMVENDISDVAGNKTRFLLVEAGRVDDVLKRKPAVTSSTLNYVTSIVVDPGRDRQGLLFEILQVMSVQHGVNLITIHSRPDTRGGVVFYFDLEGHPESEKIGTCLRELRRFCSEATSKTAQIYVLGAYPRTPFYELPFKTVGIVGSAGIMGQWFKRFFTDAGLNVLECDQESGEPIETLAKKADVIVLSVPMSAAEKVVQTLMPLLRSGQLIVENCSVKSCVLPALVQEARPDIELLGIHTMFGGDVPSLLEQNVIFTHTERSGARAQAFEDLLYKYGATIRHASVEQHDITAAFIQSTLQLSMLILADVMTEAFEDPVKLEFMSTPNFRNTWQTMTRVLKQSEDLLVDLQTQNIFAERMRHRFLEAACRLTFALDQKNIEVFLESIRKSLTFVGKLEN